jgi:hypothetical protein
MAVSSVASINRLPAAGQRALYKQLIPPEILAAFNLSEDLKDAEGHDLFHITGAPGSSDVELKLYHQHGFEDPIIYGHLTDTLNGQIHILLYVMNDPAAPRFDVDRLPDGTPTSFGTAHRNLEAERTAMEAGLLPGQVRAGLHLLGEARVAFEVFVRSLGHDRYFVEPLYYHNAIIFERYGLRYQRGRRRMESIHAGFQPGGELHAQLDGSTFRPQHAGDSLRLRSWAIHDGVLGGPYSNVTMYRVIGQQDETNTAPGVKW